MHVSEIEDQPLRPQPKGLRAFSFQHSARGMAWAKTSRHVRGYGTAWTKLRQVILNRDQYLCQHCLAKGIATQGNHVDHIKPKAKGGDDDMDNLQTLCKPCHDAKTADEGPSTRKPVIAFSEDGWPI